MLRQTLFNMPGLSRNEEIILNEYLDEYPSDRSIDSILSLLRANDDRIVVNKKYENRSSVSLSTMIVEQLDNLNAVENNTIPNFEDAGNGMMCGRRR